MSVVGLVLSILFPLVGIIVSIVAWKQAAETGDNRGLAKAGIIVGAVLLALNIIFSFVFLGAMATATMDGTLTSP
jgi:tryptophan-rich sensory protein